MTIHVTCVGAGYVGGPTMAVMAKHCPAITFTVCDINRRRIDAWNSDDLPIFEPGLQDLIMAYRGVNLFFTTDIKKAIEQAEIILIAVNTPTKDFGHWGGCGYDMSAYEEVSRSIAKYAQCSKVVVEKSTVPVRTAALIRAMFDTNKNSEDIHFEVVSNPEFLAEGTAVRDLETPDRVLIGSLATPEGRAAAAKLKAVYAHWVPDERIIGTGLWSSELAKLSCNAMLSQRISSINSFSALCERTGADVTEIAHVLGTDKRIGPHFLNASIGFGGSCFGKDLLGLVYLCDSFDLPEVAAYWKNVITMNEYQKLRFAKLIVKSMFENVKRKNICILGAAFKKNTGDFRESPAIDVVRFLLQEGANVFMYDPKVNHAEIKALFPQITCFSSAYHAAFEAHAVVILTEWDEFKTLDYSKIISTMQKPAYLFDGRNIVNHKQIAALGYKCFCVGKGFVEAD